MTERLIAFGLFVILIAMGVAWMLSRNAGETD